jgi:hypothetical protein
MVQQSSRNRVRGVEIDARVSRRKVRALGNERVPCVDVSGARRKERQCSACPASNSSPLRSFPLHTDPAIAVAAAGVHHCCASRPRHRPPPAGFIAFASDLGFVSWDIGVAHDCEAEQPLSSVRRADFLRSEQARRNSIAHALKLSGDDVESESKMAGDVLEENTLSCRLPNDTRDVRPQVARIVRAPALSCEGERLARVARSDEIHDSTPRAAVEGSQIAPHREAIDASLAHRPRQVRAGAGFPLNPADDASAGNGQLDAEVEPSASGAE